MRAAPGWGYLPSPWSHSAGPLGLWGIRLLAWRQGRGRRKSHKLPTLPHVTTIVAPQVSGSDRAPAAGRGA